ncbi:hypothetical protein F4778DRAFT_163728 [Xylariomycetidae sp. FL2044]|nr:hypothetical protein F4778DRAFT_163728 [Xylariomycetidae sp. FL2044]
MTNLEINIERPRFQLVKDACAEGDLFFIALHQVFCVWTAKQGAFHQMCAEGVHDPSLMDNAFGIMGSILKSNSKLRQQHLTWFATFPVDLRPAPQLCDDATYALALRQVLDFLTYVSHRWMVVNHKHQTDGYPLLMSELLGTFGLFSPILQGIVFRASRRTLGVIDGPFGTQMEELFRADQQAHQNDDGSFKIQPPSQEYQKYNDSLKGNYKILIAQHFAAQGQSTQQGNQTHAQQLHRFPMANQTARTAAAPGSNPNNPTPPRFGVPYHPHTQSPINSPLNVQSPTTTPNSAYYPAAVPVQFTLPSNTAPPMQLPSQYATAYNSPNLNYQTVPGPSGPHGPQQTYQPQQFMAQPRRFSQPSRSSSASQLQVPQGSRQQMHYSVQTPPPYTFTTPHQPAVTNPSVQTPQLGPIPQTPSVSPTPSLMGQVPSHHRAPSRSAPLAHHERLIPAPRLRIGIQDHPHSPYEKRSVEISLHQVHLRSPKRIPGEIPAMSERHYQSIKSFAFGPQVTPPRSTLYHISFTISDADLTKVSRDEMVRGEHLPVSRFASGSLRIRIRCCYKNPASPNTEHAWVTTDTLWPEHIYMELNGVALGIKRKAHHSKDLPAEASSLVKAGANLLRVFIPNANSKYPGLEPHIAVEVVEVLSHSAILQMVREFGTLPSSVTRNVISSRLNGASSVANDDDLAMVMDGLSIDLADPFTFQMFRVPVRGVSCTHLECFDLETWLNTRLGKKSCYHASASDCGICPKEPSFVDKWKCPLCDGDARPYSLRIDEFLVEVRAKLESDQMLRTKSILVSADGSWKPREQSASDDSDHESDDGCTLAAKTDNTTPMLATPKQRERLQVEVIELDDD